MKYTKPFRDLSKEDAAIAGGKGASLGEMLNSGISVPDGFVVLSSTFDEFIEQTDLVQEIEAVLDSVDHRAIHTVDKASDKIRELIISREIPEGIKNEIMQSFKILGAGFVAVRSSATAEDGADNAWAGQLESYLNVTEKDVLEKVKECWSSLFTARAIFYRFEKDLQLTKISVAVVVQKMVNSEKSGIAFSVHPVTEDRNQLIIEAGYGLGEAIVSGSVTPDSYVVSKNPREIIDINVGSQNKALYRDLKDGGNKWIELDKEKAKSQVLSEKEIFEFSEIVIGIENHYGFPCDIEWAYEGGKFYIVQSRPITTLQNKSSLGKTVTLVKYFSRDHSLFYIYLWRASNCEKAIDWLGKNWHEVLYVRPQGQEEVDVWYSDKEMDQYRKDIESHIKNDPNWFPLITNYFEERWNQIFKFIKKNPQTHDEFKKFTSLWLEWWEPMAIMMQAPEATSLPKELSKHAFDLRAKTQEYSDQADVIYKKYIQHAHPELAKYHSVLLPQEVIDDKFPDYTILEERLGGWFLTDDTFGLALHLDEILEEKKLILQKDTLNNSNGLTGQTAYQGVVRGVARIVKKQSDLGKVLVGDILISPMTTPDFIPAMQKAAAFVTDEGGITCHAAIVARELKKPCIIGTKIATQVLKDGDLVEVDADNGVVRILNKKDDSDVEIKKFKESIQTINLVKEHSREYSIAQINSYCEIINKVKDEMNCSIENELFLYNPQNKLVSIYHEPQELKNLFAAIGTLATDESFLKRILSSFEESLSNIKPYLENKKAVKDVAEFEVLYNLFSQFYLGIAYVWVLPLLGYLPENVKNKALKLREETEQYSSRRDRVLIDNLKVIFPEVGDLVKYLSIDEIKKGKINKELIQQLEERSNGFIYYKNNIYQGNLYEDFFANNPIRLDDQVIDKNIDNIRGSVGFKGFVRGVVRLIFTEKDLDSFKQGEILVSPMTRPEFLPVMREAAAFVTDEGGITCHAAIVARELKKPCIIGTKFATQVLKDGDLVEVDADNGVVRILNKKDDSGVDIKKFKESTKNREYITQQGDISIALLGNICNAIQEEYISIYGYDNIQPILTMQKESRGICYFDLEMYRDFSRVSYSRIKDSVYNLPEYKDYQRLSKIIDSEYKDFSISKDTNKLKEKILNYFEIAKKYLVSSLYCEAVDHQIVKELAEKSKVKNIEKFIEISILPTRPSFINHQNKLLLEGEDISWSFTNYFSSPTKDERLDLLNKKRKEFNKREIENEIENTKKTSINNQKLVNELIKNCSDEQKRVVEFVQASINIRDERKEFILKLFTILSDSLRNLAERYNIPYGLISTISDNEIDKLDDPSFLEILKERYEEGVAMISSNNKPQISIVDYELSKKIIFDNLAIENNNIYGISANKGFCKGIVKIITSVEDFHIFQEGEVLVTGMTRAEYVPLMRKAGAIITDEGGVTCHAAIISRELKKPCIIGTKIATQVLKDGDLVEVDADNGVVRVLEKEESTDLTIYNITKQFLETRDIDVQSATGSIFNVSICYWAYANSRDVNFGNYLPLTFFRVLENQTSPICDNEEIKQVTGFYYDDYLKNGNKINKFLSLQNKAIKEILRKGNKKDKTKKDLGNLIKSIVFWWEYCLLGEDKGKYYENKIKQILISKEIRGADLDSILNILSTPKEKSIFVKEREDFYKICIGKLKNENITKEIDLYIKEYFYMDTSFYDRKIIDQASLNKKIEIEIEGKKIDYFINNLKDLSNNNKEIENKRKEILKQYSFNKEELRQIEFMIIFSNWLNTRKENMMKTFFFMADVVHCVADIYNKTYKEIAKMTFKEIENLLSLNKEIEQSELQKRDECLVCISGENFNFIYGNKSTELFNSIYNIHNKNEIDLIKGNAAYSSMELITGRVKIVMDPLKDILSDGEILVTSMTRIEFVPLMKKAKAIITDEGGISCHAAIISRELSIPCIVGTKIATQVLKDGDIVEVDADKGIIRIIK